MVYRGLTELVLWGWLEMLEPGREVVLDLREVAIALQRRQLDIRVRAVWEAKNDDTGLSVVTIVFAKCVVDGAAHDILFLPASSFSAQTESSASVHRLLCRWRLFSPWLLNGNVNTSTLRTMITILEREVWWTRRVFTVTKLVAVIGPTVWTWSAIRPRIFRTQRNHGRDCLVNLRSRDLLQVPWSCLVVDRASPSGNGCH